MSVNTEYECAVTHQQLHLLTVCNQWNATKCHKVTVYKHIDEFTMTASHEDRQRIQVEKPQSGTRWSLDANANNPLMLM